MFSSSALCFVSCATTRPSDDLLPSGNNSQAQISVRFWHKAPLQAGLLLRVGSDSKGTLLPRDDGLWGDSAAQPCESGRAASSLASLEPFTAARPQSPFSGSCEMMYAKALSAASSRQSWHGWGILSEMPGAPVSNAKLNLNHVVALSSL